jgi:hypothetical protein
LDAKLVGVLPITLSDVVSADATSDDGDPPDPRFRHAQLAVFTVSGGSRFAAEILDLLSRAAQKNSGKQRNNSGRRRGRSTRRECTASQIHIGFLQ